MDKDLQLKSAKYSSWTEFFTTVMQVAAATGKPRDQVCEQFYTPEVEKTLGKLPTPPWYL